MIRIIVVLGVVVALYSSSALVRAKLAINEVENYVSEALLDVAQPWSSSRLTARASIWLNKHSGLKPDEIVRKGKVELGDLAYIDGDPDCDLYKGIAQHESVERNYSDCTVVVRFEKKSASISVRLVKESENWKINNFISIK
ncbi:hypothetical protein [Marinobacterium aestuarii]|uniref:hypothetical protein n=1 Tax=Marinobacterium aestuarii TaxID=1821621 RepID=UPI0012FFC200|nr:hypothetical protein [Marinobacterium aestuarii]